MTTPTSMEPSRLKDEPGESTSLERALLRVGSSYRTSPQTRARVLAGLGLAGSTTLLAGTVAAASSAANVTKMTWMTKLLLGASVVGAAAVPVGYYALRHPTAPASRPAASLPMVSEPTAVPAAQDSPVAPTANSRAAALLTEELGALDHARLSLANGDARRALEELDAYDHRYPHGRLQIEAEVLRIDALAKVGHRDVARQHAEAFLRHHPNSVLATRVRAHLAD
jgi:hypothetical protein